MSAKEIWMLLTLLERRHINRRRRPTVNQQSGTAGVIIGTADVIIGTAGVSPAMSAKRELI